jgi:CRISPR-associated endonuclease/helicase Cas3
MAVTPSRAPDDDARVLCDLVRNGGAVARICNRVDDAQAIYRELMGMAPDDFRVLLHSRIPLRDRQQREQRIVEMVGKTTNRTPDQPMIIVGTQVLEQSLDYDVDVMISDFAPIDLLLQRAGRLHRHDRHRPHQHCHPVIHVHVPIGDDGEPQWDKWGRIYERMILNRTWNTLRSHGSEITLPRDYRTLIEMVYDGCPTSFLGAVDAATARNGLTPSVSGDDGITVSLPPPPTPMGTRLGESITVVPLYRDGDGVLSLDPSPHTGWVLHPDIPPNLDMIRECHARSIPISRHDVIAEVVNEAWPWECDGLRHLYPLVFNAHAGCGTMYGRAMISLHDELGLVFSNR